MIWRSLRGLTVAATIFMAVALLPLAAQTGQQPLAVTRITQLIDDDQLVTLHGNVHPLSQAQYDRGPAPASMAMGRTMLVLQPSAAQKHALADFLVAVHNPGSPSYRKWITPAQFGTAYGLTDDDLQSVENWLQSHGLKIERISRARNVIEFSGSVEQVQSAFHTSIHTFLVNGEKHFANVSDPQIPAALAPVVAGVGPLNDFRPRPQAELGGTARYDTASRSIQPEMTLFGSNNLPYLWIGPSDAATIYDTPNAALNPSYSGQTYDGTGVSIGIVGDSNVTMQDIQNYRVAFLGETASTANLPTVVVDGSDPGINGDEVEALLDTEIAGGIAPRAKIYLYTSESGVGSSMVRALDDNNVNILNISFGGCEQDQGNSGNAFLLAWAEQAAAQGISVTVSSGDSGPANCDGRVPAARFGFAVNGIASTPWTIAVGGTDFSTLPANFSQYANSGSSGSAPYYRSAKSYIPEVPWNDSTTVNTSISANVPYKNASGNTNMTAAGGGASGCVTEDSGNNCLGGHLKPSFQTSLTPNDGVRDLPDVSLFASNGFDQAVWTVCADNVANEDTSSTYTDCQTTNGQLTSSSTFSGYGGTSTSAPAFAGMLALVSQAQGGARLGQADFVLYQLAKSKLSTVFHDTTVGDNSIVCVSGSPNCSNGFMTGYNATAGYDQASGLGSVDAAALVASWSSVSLASTATTLNINGSASALTAVHGTPLTFNVAVTPSSASGVAGIVDTANESSGGSLLNGQFAIPLSAGSGSANYNGLPGGTYTVAARYGGDTSDAASTSTPIDVTISPENSAAAISGFGCFPPPLSTLCLGFGSGGNATPITMQYGSEIEFGAQVSGTSADELKNGTQGVATGTVTFASGSTVLGTVRLGVANQVSWPTAATTNPYIPAGSYNIVAQYSGDASFHPAVSPEIALTISKGSAGTNISSVSSTSIPWSGSTTITVGVDSLADAVPTGTVTLTANGSTLATITNFTQLIPYADIEGTAAIQASQLAVGPNVITATYSGDSNYNSSSATVTVTVTSTPPIGFTLGNSGNIVITPGQFAGNSTITVTPAGGFTGQVNLACAITTSPGALTAVPLACNVAPSVNIATASGAATPLTISAPSNTLAGTYVVSVSGTNAATGVVMARTTVNVTVGPSYGFALNNSGNITVVDGNIVSNYVQIAITAFGGFSGNINMSCIVAQVQPNPTAPPTCTFPATESIGPGFVVVGTMLVNTTSSTTAGQYVFTVTGTDAATGTVTASTSMMVNITGYNQGYTLSNSGDIVLASATSVATSTITVTPFGGFNGVVTLTGASLYLNGSSVHNAVQISSTNSVTGVHVSTTLNVSAPSGVDFYWTVTSPVTITGTSPATATLTVTAVSITAPSFGFTLGSSGNISVNPGATTGNTAAIAVSSTGGFSGQINLSCAVTTSISNPVDLPTCSIPVAVNILGGSSGASTVLTVNTTAASSAINGAPAKKLFLPGEAVALGLLIFLIIPARRQRWITMLGLFALIVVSAGLGCGGSSSGPTPPQGGGGTTAGAYIVTVTATDGATGKLNASATVNVNVM